jgi:hypothetical protein
LSRVRAEHEGEQKAVNGWRRKGVVVRGRKDGGMESGEMERGKGMEGQVRIRRDNKK